ncbi:MAG: proline--tRNA ligase [Syntrophomonadaceae bacterium]
MKSSELFYPTLREVPNEAEVVSHQLLLRAGFIRKASGGIYTYLPLGYRVIKKIMNIVREEMDRAGGQEILMPIIQPGELWQQSGRWDVYGDEMFRLKDRHGRNFSLGPTHEEIITSLVNGDAHSYRDLPLLLYQIQNKYRDEIRPRFGLMRGREFIMKDLYSFDVDNEGLDDSYRKMYTAYQRVFSRMNLDFRVVEADSGAIGGNESHEFMVLADTGECTIVYCDSCDYAANVEKAQCVLDDNHTTGEEMLDMVRVHTPGQRTIKDLVEFLGCTEDQQVKTLTCMADDELIAVVLRGDRELNEIKLKNALGCNNVYLADEAEVIQQVGAGFGSLGPVGLNLKVYVDQEVTRMKNFTCGANQDDYHYKNVNIGRDFVPEAVVDVRSATAGDICPHCRQGKLQAVRGIEVGHIFKLGTKYSQAMDAVFLDQKGKEQLMVMGCYGIGISRTMAAAVEQNNDQHGIIWPIPIAPYQVIIVPVNAKNRDQMQAAHNIYDQLQEKGIEVIMDDRDERAGVKFKDADLIGIPVRITIGPKSLQENKVEVKKRWEKESELVDLAAVIELVTGIINKGFKL